MLKNKKKRSAKKTAFVPRMIFQTAVTVVVVPYCACGAKTLGQPDSGIGFTVACEAFDGGPCGVALGGFDSGPDVYFTVACEGFDGGPCGVGLGFDVEAPDVGFVVAAQCFDGGNCPGDEAGTSSDGSVDGPMSDGNSDGATEKG
jgi:hypothetical protein